MNELRVCTNPGHRTIFGASTAGFCPTCGGVIRDGFGPPVEAQPKREDEDLPIAATCELRSDDPSHAPFMGGSEPSAPQPERSEGEWEKAHNELLAQLEHLLKDVPQPESVSAEAIRFLEGIEGYHVKNPNSKNALYAREILAALSHPPQGKTEAEEALLDYVTKASTANGGSDIGVLDKLIRAVAAERTAHQEPQP